jgi:hypothetical protein
MTVDPAARPARLTLRRRSPRDAQQRQIVASMDGEPFATLLFGETESREIPPGPHRLRVHNTLVWKTVEFTARPGEEVVYTIINRAGWGTWWMLSLLGAGPLYLTVVRGDQEEEIKRGDNRRPGDQEKTT